MHAEDNIVGERCRGDWNCLQQRDAIETVGIHVSRHILPATKLWPFSLRDLHSPGKGSSHYLFRSYDPKGAREYLAKIFAWYCALSNRIELDIEDALWEKYPSVCPRCLSPACECLEPPKKIDSERLTMLALENAQRRPMSLREWQVMFASIYRGPSGKQTVPASRDRVALVFARMAENSEKSRRPLVRIELSMARLSS